MSNIRTTTYNLDFIALRAALIDTNLDREILLLDMMHISGDNHNAEYKNESC